MIYTSTIEEDARTYVNVLNSPPNAWGGNNCKVTGMTSHHMLQVGNDRHGEINFQDVVDTVFKSLKEENTS